MKIALIVKLIFFYNHELWEIDDLIKTKKKLNEIIGNKFQDSNIKIILEIIFGSKTIQSINILDFILENGKTKEKN